ncbi:MAG: hypothetical protein KAR08_11005, partial [Candidatus Heimdallarchaeota archaeon]|nr:hypothetical protein [Candidatus Heimdallarchaeota archaeon]
MNPYSDGNETIVRAVNFDGTRRNNQFPNEQSFNLSVFDSSEVLLETNESITISYGGIITFDGQNLVLKAEFYSPPNTINWITIGLVTGGVLIIIVLVIIFVYFRKKKTRLFKKN